MDWFEFEYGDASATTSRPSTRFTKILVRYDAEGNAGDKPVGRETEAPRPTGSTPATASSCVELLGPPRPHQLGRSAATRRATTPESRPGSWPRRSEQFEDAGIEADIWKIEGIDRREDCEMITRQRGRDGRDGVGVRRARTRRRSMPESRTAAPGFGAARLARGRDRRGPTWWISSNGYLDDRSAALRSQAASHRAAATASTPTTQA